MMVVGDARLVQGRGSGGLNAPNDALLDEYAEGVVYRLTRDGPDLRIGQLGDSIRGDMRLTRYGSQDSQALRRDMESVFAKKVRGFYEHDVIMPNYLD
jgi:hypothetical protein